MNCSTNNNSQTQWMTLYIVNLSKLFRCVSGTHSISNGWNNTYLTWLRQKAFGKSSLLLPIVIRNELRFQCEAHTNRKKNSLWRQVLAEVSETHKENIFYLRALLVLFTSGEYINTHTHQRGNVTQQINLGTKYSRSMRTFPKCGKRNKTKMVKLFSTSFFLHLYWCSSVEIYFLPLFPLVFSLNLQKCEVRSFGCNTCCLKFDGTHHFHFRCLTFSHLSFIFFGEMELEMAHLVAFGLYWNGAFLCGWWMRYEYVCCAVWWQ